MSQLSQSTSQYYETQKPDYKGYTTEEYYWSLGNTLPFSRLYYSQYILDDSLTSRLYSKYGEEVNENVILRGIANVYAPGFIHVWNESNYQTLFGASSVAFDEMDSSINELLSDINVTLTDISKSLSLENSKAKLSEKGEEIYNKLRQKIDSINDSGKGSAYLKALSNDITNILNRKSELTIGNIFSSLANSYNYGRLNLKDYGTVFRGTQYKMAVSMKARLVNLSGDTNFSSYVKYVLERLASKSLIINNVATDVQSSDTVKLVNEGLGIVNYSPNKYTFTAKISNSDLPGTYFIETPSGTISNLIVNQVIIEKSDIQVGTNNNPLYYDFNIEFQTATELTSDKFINQVIGKEHES